MNRQWNLALPLPPPQSALLAGRGITAPLIVSNADKGRIQKQLPATKELPWWQKYGSEIVWGLWFAIGIGWEIFAVLTEKRTGQEPLTRILRDRLMRRPGIVGWGVRLGFIAFWGWLALHWLVPLAW